VTSYAGLTWDHPRGYESLEAAAARWAGKGVRVYWRRQALEGFEAHPLRELCDVYDLVVLDHPHVGEAAGAGCLHPLEAWLSAAEISLLRRDLVGPVLDSYRHDGRHWALPLDAATQVMASRPDLTGLSSPARTWDDVVRLSERVPVVLSLGGPHALLTFYSICAAHASVPHETVLHDGAAAEALAIMEKLAGGSRYSPVSDLNPIGILETLATTDAVACCPLVYGYVNYAVSRTPGRQPVTFSDAPSARRGVPGSTLGGTGLGVSRRVMVTDALRECLLWLSSPAAQGEFIPAHAGQPARRDAWESPAVNAAAGCFYRSTLASIENAWVRPRRAGFIAFQARGSAILREGLRAGNARSDFLDRLRTAAAAISMT
jgi:multiple sugar transport system substrate-binding protein